MHIIQIIQIELFHGHASDKMVEVLQVFFNDHDQMKVSRVKNNVIISNYQQKQSFLNRLSKKFVKSKNPGDKISFDVL